MNYLDECRKSALFAKSQERALLATVVTRKAIMSNSFSHAYVSSMVRAGEALGHGPLFEAVQNESCGVSTMIPYDVFTDELGAWEDPCRPKNGYTETLTEDDAIRKSHARAMIQKSLRKLQDRQNLKGGAQSPGPYTDSSIASTNNKLNHFSASSSRGGSHKRRSSLEPLIHPGSGSAPATSWTLYEPKHHSPPLDWGISTKDNPPYGNRKKDSKSHPSSVFQDLSASKASEKGHRRRQSVPYKDSKTLALAPLKKSSNHTDDEENQGVVITREIPWQTIAGLFQKAQHTDIIKQQKEREAQQSSRESIIFAPVVQKLDSIPFVEYGDDEDLKDEEENVTDGYILSRHRAVLETMKERLAFVLKNKKKSQGTSHQ